MPEEQQKIVLHLCGCFMYVRICLEASKYKELGRFQDCFYIRSDPREDMGKKSAPKIHQLQTVTVRTPTSDPLVHHCILFKNQNDKNKAT